MRMKRNSSHVTFISAYAPTMVYSDQAKEEFYEHLDHAIQSVTHSDKLFLLGDFNARVGSDHTTWYKILGHRKGKLKWHPFANPVRREAAGHHQWAILHRRIALRRLGDTHALVIGIKLIFSSSGRNWYDVKLTRAAKASICHPDHALLKSKVSISFQLKIQHQRVQRTKKLDVAKLANSETQDTLRDNIASALRTL